MTVLPMLPNKDIVVNIMRKDLKIFYDNLYKQNQGVFGFSSVNFLKEVFKKNALLSGRALDIGAGEGLTSNFLAKHGFLVDAVDISENALSEINNSNVFVHHTAIEQFPFNNSYNLVHFALVMHHLSNVDAKLVIQNAQRATLLGGIHIYRIFTTNSNFYKKSQDQGFYDDGVGLDTEYKNWQISFDEKVFENAATQSVENEIRHVVYRKKNI